MDHALRSVSARRVGSPSFAVDAAAAVGPVELWSAQRLTELVPGSTRKLWLTSWVPALVKAGALVKRGKGWLGRSGAIEAGLLAAGTVR